MSLIKFRPRRPLGSLSVSDLFDSNSFMDDSLLSNRLLNGDFWNGRTQEPALNVKETENAFEVELAAPGFTKKDFKVNIDDGCLNILAEKTDSKEEKDENYTRKEFNYNSFEKSLQLPDSVKDEDIKAKYKDGILSFNLSKRPEAKAKKPKMIEIV
jgi:HSP20 family protein